MKLWPEPQRDELGLDLIQRKEADLGRVLAVAFNASDGISVERHPDATRLDRPVDELADDLAVSVRGLGSEPLRADLRREEVRHRGRRDLLDVHRGDRPELAASIFREPALPALLRPPGVEHQFRTALAEALTEVGEIPSPGPLGTMGPHVLDEGGDHLPHRRSGRKGGVLPPELCRLEAPELLLGYLERVRPQAPPPLLVTLVPLNEPDRTTLLETAHPGPPSAFWAGTLVPAFQWQGTEKGTSAFRSDEKRDPRCLASPFKAGSGGVIRTR